MIIVNGGKGIGTGFSYEGLSYNPKDVVTYLKDILKDKTPTVKFKPYYEGFTGNIKKIDEKKYLILGKYKMLDYRTIQITELPIGSWTVDYKNYLESLMDNNDKKGKKTTPLIKEIVDLSTDSKVDFTVRFVGNEMQKLITKKWEYGCNMLEKKLKLYTTKSETNMYLFDKDQRLKKYNSIEEIINEYFVERFKGYKLRKQHMINELNRIVMLLTNKARFIEEQCDEVIDLRKKKKATVIELLKTRNYDVIDNDNEYKYLRQMRIESVEEENIVKLRNERDEKMKEFEILKNTSERKMWLTDLKQFDKLYEKYLINRQDRVFGKVKKKKIKKLKFKKGK
jgi:DNA topoisomerase-2